MNSVNLKRGVFNKVRIIRSLSIVVTTRGAQIYENFSSVHHWVIFLHLLASRRVVAFNYLLPQFIKVC